MIKVRCTVYNGGEKLFHLDGDNMVVVACATRRMVRTEYPALGDGLEWKFKRIYPPAVAYEPPDTLSEWDEYVQAYREGLRREDDREDL